MSYDTGMRFYADLHIHSKYSRATSKDCDLENLAYWGRKKGISVIGTGDFTHPAWIGEIKDKLVPAEPGLFRLRDDIDKAVAARLPASCRGDTRFMLSVEISTIYKKGDKTRKIHHLIYAPTIEQAETINRQLEKIGNIRSDGRPILGLDSRHLLEIVLNAGEDCYLVPAHIWTPWFAVLGSKSGFDSVTDCYGDLAEHIFAVETGLSSDPEMNWRVSGLDRYRLVSNSDAHSPPKLGREACVFDTDRDYFAMRRALETGAGYGGTVEFFPEEGKYHMDGHRKCGVRLSPDESRALGGLCPVCKRPLTLGVLYRVEELADRGEDGKPEDTDDFVSLVPLPEMLSETEQVGAASKAVAREYEGLIGKLGAELGILNDLPLEEIRSSAPSSLIPEAIGRMRAGEVIREPGFDGEYGRIRLFEEKELRRNYRSGRSIVTAATQMIEPATLIADREVQALPEDTGKVVIHEARSDKAEAESVVHNIEQLLGGLSFYSIDTNRSDGTAQADYTFADFAVLYRTEAQADVLEEALLRSGIPFQRRGHQALSGLPQVQVLLETMATLDEHAVVTERLREAAAQLTASDEKDAELASVMERLEAIAERCGDRWQQFLSEIHIAQAIDVWDERADRVSLLTLHAAKGLEFRVVFVTGCEDGVLPLKWQDEIADEELAEERRLFYVGMTRAKERLFLLHARKRHWRGRLREQQPSPFLDDIEARLLEIKRLGGKKKTVEKSPQLGLL